MIPTITRNAQLATKRVSRFSAPLLPLDYFLNKTAALSLYRSFIRATRGLGDLRARQETVAWVRDDFEKYRHEVESVKCKTLLALGGRQLKQLNSTGMLIGSDGVKWRGSRRAGRD